MSLGIDCDSCFVPFATIAGFFAAPAPILSDWFSIPFVGTIFMFLTRMNGSYVVISPLVPVTTPTPKSVIAGTSCLSVISDPAGISFSFPTLAFFLGSLNELLIVLKSGRDFDENSGTFLTGISRLIAACNASLSSVPPD